MCDNNCSPTIMSEKILNSVGILDADQVKRIVKRESIPSVDFSRLPTSLEKCLAQPDTRPNTYRVCQTLISKKGASANDVLGKKHTDIGSVSAKCYRSLQQDMLGARLPAVNIEAKVHNALGYGIPNLNL